MLPTFPPNTPAIYTTPNDQAIKVTVVTGRPRPGDGWLLICRDKDGGMAWAEPGRLAAGTEAAVSTPLIETPTAIKPLSDKD